MNDIVTMLRVTQWYKNLVIFVALFFSKNLFNIPMAEKSILGFISLCLVSSSYYIINDIADIKKDRYHPEKRERPFASGRVGIGFGLIIMFLLLSASLYIASSLPRYFLYSVVFLFLFSLLYTFVLKKEVFLDAIGVAINFVVKANSGVFALQVEVSPWIITSVFFLALFLVFGKRQADLLAMEEMAHKYNPVLVKYSKKMLGSLLTMTTTCLIVFYTLYCILVGGKNLLVTLPVAMYIVMRYLNFIHIGSVIARNPEKVFADKRMLASLIVWLALVVLVLYIFPELTIQDL